MNTDANMEIKKILAWAIASAFHGQAEADRVSAEWERIHQAGGEPDPENVPVISGGSLLDIVVAMRKCSRSEARRLIISGAVRLNGEKVQDKSLGVTSGTVNVGNKDFARIA